MEKYDPRVDAFIEKSAAFAQPVLKHIRQLVHETSPLISESIKWGFPFFEYKGPVCHMNAFKEHCAFGFWNVRGLVDPQGYLKLDEEKSAAGSFGRVTSLADLPGDDALRDFILQGIALNEKGIKIATPKKAPVEKKELVTPHDFIALLDENHGVKTTFENFSYSHKKEYLEWITEAKTEVTRQKRMQSAIEMIGEGKSKNWKYQR